MATHSGAVYCDFLFQPFFSICFDLPFSWPLLTAWLLDLGHICLGRLDLTVVYDCTWLPSTTGDNSSGLRTGASENTPSPISAGLCLTSPVQLPFLPFLFSLVAPPELFCAPLASSKPLFSFSDTCCESHLVQNRELVGGGHSSASENLSPSAPSFPFSSCDLGGDGLYPIPPNLYSGPLIFLLYHAHPTE